MYCSGKVFQLLAGVATVTVPGGIIPGPRLLTLQGLGSESHSQQHRVRTLLFSVIDVLLGRTAGNPNPHPLDPNISPSGVNPNPKMLPKCAIREHRVFHHHKSHWHQGGNGESLPLPTLGMSLMSPVCPAFHPRTLPDPYYVSQ